MDTFNASTLAIQRPQFNKFLNPQTALRLLDEAGVVTCWDFNCAMGKTIRDKYDSLCVKIVEATAILLARGAHGHFWIVTSPEVYSIMDTATGDKPIIVPDGEHLPMSLTEGQLKDMGVLSKRWRVFVTEQFPSAKILIGADYEQRDCTHYARLNISSFII